MTAVAGIAVALIGKGGDTPVPPVTTTATAQPVPPTTTSVRSNSWIDQTSANRSGTVVFKDPQGRPADTPIPRIPYGTTVKVVCQVPNGTGMTSVSALYLIGDSAPWSGLYAVSDTFTNGDPLDPPGSTTVDPRVPSC
ncbi:hypothetical protein GCM10023175_53750 [Pseudonocardia xishanensis]|uniref:Ig-like domain-containing protein n=1 Tax=Pseudonocardia xishanensis TaxID=630995 RepID=A0ABP8S131_9PSEU